MQPAKRKWTRSPARLARYESEREAIMRSAYRLIGRADGSVSVQEILEAAGLSTRAFYRHFASKDELILAMYRTDNQRVAEALWGATEAAPDAWSVLRAWVDVSLSVVFDEGRERHSRVLGSGEAKSTAGWSKEFLEGMERQIESLRSVLERGRRDGMFPTTHLRTDSLVIFAATQHFNTLRLHGGPGATTREEALGAVMEAARRMLGAPEDPPPGETTSKRRRRPAAAADPTAGYPGSGSMSRAKAKRAARP